MYSSNSELPSLFALVYLTCGFYHALSPPVKLLLRDAQPSRHS